MDYELLSISTKMVLIDYFLVQIGW